MNTTQSDRDMALETIPEFSNLQVMSYLIMTHHEFTRNIMEEIAELLDQARRELDNPPPELAELTAIWTRYQSEMLKHLYEEEKILFPWIEETTQGSRSTAEISKTYSPAIHAMLTEHEHHEDEIVHVRKLADRLSIEGGYVPVLALLAYKLKQLDTDLREHMEIESKLLFPRVLGDKV